MTADCFCRMDNLINRDGFGVMRYAGTQLLPGYGLNAIVEGFLIADDTAGDMPAGAIIVVIPPCQQDAIKYLL